MRILIACEFSGIVREAFAIYGHDVWSCDLLPPEDGSLFHLKRNCLEILENGWDLMIAHPPCTFLASSGARWFKQRKKQQNEALEFVQKLMQAPIEKIAIENPIGVISTHIRKPDQIIQPWQFGHGETKAHCLWLKNLAPLKSTRIMEARYPRVWYTSPGPNRWRERSRTYKGIAKAMAEQWGQH